MFGVFFFILYYCSLSCKFSPQWHFLPFLFSFYCVFSTPQHIFSILFLLFTHLCCTSTTMFYVIFSSFPFLVIVQFLLWQCFAFFLCIFVIVHLSLVATSRIRIQIIIENYILIFSIKVVMLRMVPTWFGNFTMVGYFGYQISWPGISQNLVIRGEKGSAGMNPYARAPRE